ncbi:MAG: HDIG domain-containing protein [Clostridia bacterium]|nr:HDIG domain-containing protein [Clostridia bacterium]
MKTKLTKKEICLSMVTTLCSLIVLLAVMLLMIVINLVHIDVGLKDFIVMKYKNVISVAVGATLLTAIYYVYNYFENKMVLTQYTKIIETYLLLCVALLLCNVIGKFLNATARPLLFFPLMAAMMFQRKAAIFTNTVYVLLLFIFNRFLNSADATVGPSEAFGFVPMVESFSSLLTCFCCGIIGIVVLKHIKTRIGCVMLAFVLFIPVTVINLVVQLPESVNLSGVLNILLYCGLDCVLSVLAFMFFLPVFEITFSELTPFRLRELTSNHAKLIAKLKLQAPGTYNHSVVVAQLAEMCASAIGEDSELARAAAFYHDIGKLKNPEYFAENQTEYNFHSELTPELSVDIIRSHAREGAKLIKKYGLPEFFADVAVQHHGTLPIKYFYAKALNMSDGELNLATYSYSGPTPTSKIAAIIMIADASEAATRSLPDRSPANVEALVRSLIEERLDLEQFDDCNITMRELSVIKSTIVNQLTGVYHSRVAYPKLTISKNK